MRVVTVLLMSLGQQAPCTGLDRAWDMSTYKPAGPDYASGEFWWGKTEC